MERRHLAKQGLSLDISANGLWPSVFLNVKKHSVNKISWYLWLEKVQFYYVIEYVTDRVIWVFHDEWSGIFCQIWQIQIWALTLFCRFLVSNKICNLTQVNRLYSSSSLSFMFAKIKKNYNLYLLDLAESARSLIVEN